MDHLFGQPATAELILHFNPAHDGALLEVWRDDHPTAQRGIDAGPNIPPQADRNAAPQSGSGVVALNRSPGFWTVMGYAVLLGVVLAFASPRVPVRWYESAAGKLWFALPKNPGWLDGKPVVGGGHGRRPGCSSACCGGSFRLPGRLAGHGPGAAGRAGVRAGPRCLKEASPSRRCRWPAGRAWARSRRSG